MVLKINSKPIKVVEDTEEDKGFDPVYFTVSCLGYGLALWIMDYVCYTFFYIHPLPFISWIGGVLSWLL